MKRGKFIAFEGNDGCGKSTQMEILSQYLEKEHGITVKRFDIPSHGSKQAKLVDDYLSGSLDHLTVPQIASLYAIDQGIIYTTKGGIYETLNQGEWVITSRWYYSNLVYRGAQDLLQNEEFMSKIRQYEKSELMLIPYYIDLQLLDEIEDLTTIFLGAGNPDIVLYLQMGEKARNSILEKRWNKDVHESNKPLLNIVDAIYEYLYMRKKYGMVKINGGLKEPLSESNIHEQVRRLVKPLIDDYMASE